MNTVIRFAVLSDIHLAPAGTPDGSWNNVTRKSVSADLLRAAVAEIAAAGHERVLVLGDISDDGWPGLIRAALAAIGNAGLSTWAVPGNHDAARDQRALDLAAEPWTAACCCPGGRCTWPTRSLWSGTGCAAPMAA